MNERTFHMKLTERKSRVWWRLAMGALALLVMLTIGTAMAAVPSTTAYHFSSHPMISGTVVTVNDHQMVVDTDQGEQIPLQLDSRTMAASRSLRGRRLKSSSGPTRRGRA